MNNNNEHGAPVPPPQGDGRTTPPTQPVQPVASTQPVQSAPTQSTQAQPTQGQPAYHAQHASQQQYYQQPSYQAPTTSAQAQKSGGPKTFLLAFAGAALACIIALSGFGIYSAVTGGSGSSGSTVLGSTSNTSINATDEDQTLAEAVAQKSLPSVVAIDVYTNQSANMYGFGSGSSSSNSGSLTQSSLGSGVVLSEDGYIITNNHVVEGAAALKVTIEGNQYDAEIVGTDASSDLAVIKAKDASGLTPMEIGSSDDLIIGEWVMTLGSPFGL
ncbi:MAG: trypsin-like peptidase domain-containing protein, partial [Raoultibacter sp.]